jgi:hypothetical protein
MKYQGNKSNIITIVIVFICQFSLLSQAGFKKQFTFNNNSTDFYAIERINSDLLIIGQAGIDSSGITNIFISIIDTLGEVKSLRNYKDPFLIDDVLLSNYSFEAIEKSGDGGFIIAGSYLHSNDLFVFKIDSALNLEFFKTYESNVLARYSNKIVKLGDFYFVIGIVQTLNGDSDIFVTKVDSSGELIWEKTYGSIDLWENAQSAILEKESIAILTSEWKDPNVNEFNDELVWTRIFYIDSNGIISKEWKSLANEEGGNPEDFIKSGLNYLYITHPQYRVSLSAIWSGQQIVCRDSSFNLIWRENYSDIYWNNSLNSLIANDSSVYSVGQYSDSVSWANAIKINLINGDLIWSVKERGNLSEDLGLESKFRDVTLFPTGSLFAVGYGKLNITKSEGLLIKISSEGCIDTLCSLTDLIGELDFDKSVKIYPNPNYGETTIEVDGGGYYLEIYNVNATRVFESKVAITSHKTTIMSNWPPGIYYFIFSDKNKNILHVATIIFLK